MPLDSTCSNLFVAKTVHFEPLKASLLTWQLIGPASSPLIINDCLVVMPARSLVAGLPEVPFN